MKGTPEPPRHLEHRCSLPIIGDTMEARERREAGHVATGMEVDHDVDVGPDARSHEVAMRCVIPDSASPRPASFTKALLRLTPSAPTLSLLPARNAGGLMTGTSTTLPLTVASSMSRRRCLRRPRPRTHHHGWIRTPPTPPDASIGADPYRERYQPITPDRVVRKAHPVVTAGPETLRPGHPV